MIKQKNTGLRYKSWTYDEKTGLLKLYFDNAQVLREFAKELLKFLDENPNIDGEIFLGLTNEPKKES